MKPKPFASLNHFTIPVMRAICCTPDLMVFAAASGLHLAARRCLVLPPTLSARTLVEALPLHILKQSGSGDLAAELLQDVGPAVVVAQRHFHPAPFLRRESPPETRRGPRAVAQVLGTVSGSYRAPEHRWGARICQLRLEQPNGVTGELSRTRRERSSRKDVLASTVFRDVVSGRRCATPLT